MDRFTVQKFSFTYMRGHIGHREKYFNREQLRIYGNFEGNSKDFYDIITQIYQNLTCYCSQHINDLSLHIELPWTISKAEGIYYQLMSVEHQVPDDVRVIIGLEPLHKSSSTNGSEDETSSNAQACNGSRNSRRNSSDSANVKLGDDEVSFERGLNMSYM